MTTDEYITAVMREIKLTKAAKARVREDLESDIATRLEHGMPMDEIVAEMGTPADVAQSIAENLPPDMAQKGSPLRFVYIICAVVPLFVVVWGAFSIVTEFNANPGYYNYSTAWQYIMHGIRSLGVYWNIRLAFNLLAHMAVCGMGYKLFKNKWSAGDIRLLYMAIACGIIWLLEHPLIFGFDFLRTGYVFMTVIEIIKGLLQPQCVLALITTIFLFTVYARGQLTNAAKKTDEKIGE